MSFPSASATCAGGGCVSALILILSFGLSFSLCQSSSTTLKLTIGVFLVRKVCEDAAPGLPSLMTSHTRESLLLHAASTARMSPVATAALTRRNCSSSGFKGSGSAEDSQSSDCHELSFPEGLSAGTYCGQDPFQSADCHHCSDSQLSPEERSRFQGTRHG